MPPVTSNPLESGGNPMISASQRDHLVLHQRGRLIEPGEVGIQPGGSMSAIMPSGVPFPCTQPQ